MEAGRLADELVFGPGYTRGGPEAISGDYFADQLHHVLARNSVTGEIEPECWLHQAAKFMLTSNLPAGARIGTDIDYFMLPPIDLSEPSPLIGNAEMASALVDRPEVLAFMEFASSPEWGRVWAASASSDFTSANARFDVSTYGGRERRRSGRDSNGGLRGWLIQPCKLASSEWTAPTRCRPRSGGCRPRECEDLSGTG